MKTIAPDKVIKIVLEYHGITFEKMTKNRKRENVGAKQQIMYFMLKYCKYRSKRTRKIKSLETQRIANMLSLTNHSTVLHGQTVVNNFIETNDPIITDIINIEEIILDNLEFEFNETELQYVTRKMNYYNKRYSNLVEDVNVEYDLVLAS